MKKALIIIVTLLGMFFSATICPAQQTDSMGKTYYTVKKGDCLWKIALRNKVTIDSLYHENRLVIGENPNLIYPGQKLLIKLQVMQKEEKKTEQAKTNMLPQKTASRSTIVSTMKKIQDTRSIGKNADSQRRKNILYGIFPACALFVCALAYKKRMADSQKDFIEKPLPDADATPRGAEELERKMDYIIKPPKNAATPLIQAKCIKIDYDVGEDEERKLFVACSLDKSDLRYYVFEESNMIKIEKTEFTNFVLDNLGEKFPTSLLPTPDVDSIPADIFERENIRELNPDEWRKLLLEIEEVRLEEKGVLLRCA